MQCIKDLIEGETDCILIDEAGPYRIEHCDGVWSNSVILSSSLNPLHKGHLNMMHWAENEASRMIIPYTEFWFELTILNCDKGTIEYHDIINRIQQVRSLGRNIAVTRCPTFVQKSYLFPGATFMVGTDTIARVNDKKYCYDSIKELDKSIERIKKNGCKFVVMDRVGHSMSSQLTPGLLNICTFAKGFNPIDISSTMIREGKCSV